MSATDPIPLSKIPGLDPLKAPVIGVDHHLAPVPHDHLQAASLRQRFAQPPVWQPELLREKKFSERTPAHAAVLIGIVQREQPAVLLTLRTQHLSTHSGQIAFPGGKIDPEDEGAVAAAIREAEEEVGLRANHVEVLGTLPVYVTGTAFMVTPVVALLDPRMQLQANPHEVAEVFEVPLAFLMNPAHHRRHALDWQGARREWFSMPYPDGAHERFIWGATAGMLRNFYRFLSA